MNLDLYRAQLDRCTGPVAKPKPKPLTGIEREQLAELEEIGNEFLTTFRERRE